MRSEVRIQLEKMRLPFEEKSYDEIKELGWTSRSVIKIDGRKYYPEIWSETLPDESLLLVVQLTRWYFLKIIGTTSCIGFTLNRAGKLNHVDEHWLMNEVGHP